MNCNHGCEHCGEKTYYVLVCLEIAYTKILRVVIILLIKSAIWRVCFFEHPQRNAGRWQWYCRNHPSCPKEKLKPIQIYKTCIYIYTLIKYIYISTYIFTKHVHSPWSFITLPIFTNQPPFTTVASPRVFHHGESRRAATKLPWGQVDSSQTRPWMWVALTYYTAAYLYQIALVTSNCKNTIYIYVL